MDGQSNEGLVKFLQFNYKNPGIQTIKIINNLNINALNQQQSLTLFLILPYLLSSTTNEDNKLTILKFINQLTVPQTTEYSHLIYELTHILSSNHSLQLLLYATNSLSDIIDFYSTTKTDQIPKILPAVSCTAIKIIVRQDGKSGFNHTLVIANLSLLTKLLVPVFSTNERTEFKTDQWYTQTTTKTHQLLTLISNCYSKTNPHPKVRLQIINFTYTLLSKCYSYMTNEMNKVLLELLVVYITDDFYGDACLDRIHDLSSVFGDEKFSGILRLNFNSLLLKFDTIKRQDGRVHLLNLINGYFILLGTNINISLMVSSSGLLDRLSNVLFSMMGEEYGIGLVEDKSIIEELPQITNASTDKDLWMLLEKQDHQIQQKFHVDNQAFIKCCRLLGYYGDKSTIFDYFIQKYLDEPRNSILFIINQLGLGSIGLGISTSTPSTENTFSKRLLYEYLEVLGTDLPTSILSSKGTVKEYNTNILTISVCLQGVSIVSVLFNGSREYKCALIDVLYPVLEKLGDSNRVCSDFAYECLEIISGCVGCFGVGQLVIENQDYIINSLTKKFHTHLKKRKRKIPTTVTKPLQVLIAMIKVCGVSILPFVSADVLDDVFDLLDREEDVGFGLMLGVFDSLVEVCDEYEKVEKVKVVEEEEKVDRFKGVPDEYSGCSEIMKEVYMEVVKKWDERREEEQVHETRDINDIKSYFLTRSNKEQPQDEPEPSETPQEQDPKPTLQQSTILRIFQNLIPHTTHPTHRLKTLQILQKSIPILSLARSKFLPCIHQLWPLLIHRLTDPSRTVLLTALECIIKISEFAGEFIRKRVVETLWPRLGGLLRDGKIRAGVLDGVGRLVGNVDFNGRDLEGVLEGVGEYEEEGVERIFGAVEGVDGDLVWLYRRKRMGLLGM